MVSLSCRCCELSLCQKWWWKIVSKEEDNYYVDDDCDDDDDAAVYDDIDDDNDESVDADDHDDAADAAAGDDDDNDVDDDDVDVDEDEDVDDDDDATDDDELDDDVVERDVVGGNDEDSDDYNNVYHNDNDHQDDDNDVGGDIELLSNSNVRDCFSKPSNAVTTQSNISWIYLISVALYPDSDSQYGIMEQCCKFWPHTKRWSHIKAVLIVGVQSWLHWSVQSRKCWIRNTSLHGLSRTFGPQAGYNLIIFRASRS